MCVLVAECVWRGVSVRQCACVFTRRDADLIHTLCLAQEGIYVYVCECMAEELGAAPGSSCLERSGENVKIKNDEINA